MIYLYGTATKVYPQLLRVTGDVEYVNLYILGRYAYLELNSEQLLRKMSQKSRMKLFAWDSPEPTATTKKVLSTCFIHQVSVSSVFFSR